MYQTVLLKKEKKMTMLTYNIVTYIMYIFSHNPHITLEANKDEQRYCIKLSCFKNNKILTKSKYLTFQYVWFSGVPDPNCWSF